MKALGFLRKSMGFLHLALLEMSLVDIHGFVSFVERVSSVHPTIKVAYTACCREHLAPEIPVVDKNITPSKLNDKDAA